MHLIRGEDLYKRRMELGWSLQTAAQAIGICSSSLWRYEMNQVQNIDPEIERRLRLTYWKTADISYVNRQNSLGYSIRESVEGLQPAEMEEQELLMRYRHLDPRSRKRIQMLLEQG